MTTTRFEKIVFIFALAWYLTTAYFSNGYYHADEHYQIIEFAKLKLGTNTPADLAWEFHEQIRSSAQPALCFVILKSLGFVSILDPYIQALILRMITCLFAVFAISYFSYSCKELIHRKYWNAFYFLSFFVWFLPWINVRFSSETYSGLFFLLAISVLLRDKKPLHNYLIIGILLGLSFVFRFQTIALTFGVFMWLVFIKKADLKTNVFFGAGFLFVLSIGTIIDWWFYNGFVFTPWNYFYSNIVNNVASNFGTSPWYYYFYYIFRYSFFPLGILILLAFAGLLIKQPKSIFIWAVIPFLILHSIIPHKELRFLFPIINLVPLFLALAYQEFKDPEKQFSSATNKIALLFIISIGLINMTGLVVASIKPAGNGSIKITADINKNASCENIFLINRNGSNPFDPWDGLRAKFYVKNNLIPVDLNAATEKQEQDCIFLVLKRENLNDPIANKFILDHNMEKISESIPEWMNKILGIYGGYDSRNTLVLFKKKSPVL